VSGFGIRDSGLGIGNAQIRDAGDSALLLELDAVIDPAVNARAIGIAAAIAARRIAGVRDVIPTYRSVAVHFDPLATDVAALMTSMREAINCSPAPQDGRLIEVPVSYGGEDGPDLSDVAAFAGLSTQDVIARHCATEYRVFMLGFLPGFAYMGTVDDAIAAPRKATPRTRVPAGSVGVAGRQTGVYPRQSPGGWQLIGRTSLLVFDPSREPASLFAPGDRVRFVRIAGIRDSGLGIRDSQSAITNQFASRIPHPASRSVTVLRPGLFTTIQDAGRWGHQDRGVPVAGPMDATSHRLANALVGNARGAAALEATLTGPELRFDQPAVVAVVGADLSASIDGAPLPLNIPRACEAGAVLRFGERRAGTRACIACDGGIAVPPVLGSRATHVVSGLGGIDGRALVAGDCLPLGDSRTQRVRAARELPDEMRRGPDRSAERGGARLRIMRGPQDDWFDETAFEILQRARFTISPQSDRMGYRLTGATVTRPSGHMISDAAFTGGLQVTPSGDPILLMVDRQTTGGYPQVATVITADLPLAGQLAPGDWVEFELCTREQAVAALSAQEGSLRAIG
jgi:KipI family sensor histidine kinase inhibitor